MTANVSDTAWYSQTSSTQTMRTWARRLKSFEEIPPRFHSAFPEYGDSFPYTLLLPEDKWSLFSKRNENILCLYDERLVLLEAVRDRVHARDCPFAEVLYVEQGKILLHSWLKIKTLSDTVFLKFNTTNLYCFEPVIKKIRQRTRISQFQNGEQIGHKQELSKFNYLNTVNYKYMNYARQSIYPGDTVLRSLYQPERCVQEGVSFFNKTLFKRYATSHLSILTKRELILIKENKRTKPEKTRLYGGVFTYIPRHQIQHTSLTPDPENRCESMEISLAENIRFHSEFSPDDEKSNAFHKAIKTDI